MIGFLTVFLLRVMVRLELLYVCICLCVRVDTGMRDVRNFVFFGGRFCSERVCVELCVLLLLWSVLVRRIGVRYSIHCERSANASAYLCNFRCRADLRHNAPTYND